MKISHGRKAAPDYILLYGVEGVGKSTFAAGAPRPIFIAAEDGVRHLDVSSFDDVSTFDDVRTALKVLREETHDFRTVVIDTLDWVEHTVREKVMADNKLSPKEYDAYGRGVSISLKYWKEIASDLDALRAKGMGIILVAHAKVKPFRNPAGDDYIRYEPTLSGQDVSLFWKAKPDCVFFANYQTIVDDGGGKGPAKAKTGKRILFTVHNAAWDAKNRLGLPEIIDLDYASYADARDANGANISAEDLYEQAVELLSKYQGDKADALKEYLDKNRTNPTALQKSIEGLRERLAKQQ